MVQAEGLKAVFECLYPGVSVSYDWYINGQIHSVDPIFVVARDPLSPGAPALLMIVATPQYYNTVVQCEAHIRNGTGRRFELSSLANLVVQGELLNFSTFVVTLIIYS